MPTRGRLGRANPFDDSAEVFRQREPVQLRPGYPANIFEISPLILSAKGDGDPVLACARCPTDAVDILLWHIGEFVIDDVGDSGNIDPARGHIGGDQDADLAPAKLIKGALTLRLRFVAVDRVALNPLLPQLLHPHGQPRA